MNELSRMIKIDSTEIIIPWNDEERNLLFLQMGYKDNGIDHDSEFVLNFLISRELIKIKTIRGVLEQLPIGATILDVGAGNSLTDLVINAMYPKKKFKFILVDGSDTYDKETPWITGNTSYYQEDYSTYNDWTFLEKTIELNNMDRSMFITKTPDEEWSDHQVDLVMALSSWGWHYPVDTYLDKVNLLVKEGGWLYINELMHIDNAYNKVASLFSKNIVSSTRQWSPGKGVDSNRPKSEVERMIIFMRSRNMNPRKFSCVFLGQK